MNQLETQQETEWEQKTRFKRFVKISGRNSGMWSSGAPTPQPSPAAFDPGTGPPRLVDPGASGGTSLCGELLDYGLRLDGLLAMVSKIHRRSTTFILLLVIGSPALAGGASADRWREALKEVDQKLQTQQWETAEKQARTLAEQMVEEAGLGERASYTLALVSAFQAIAAAGLGREDEADWRWTTALNLSPDLAKTDLRPYGPAADGLRTRQVRFTDPGSQETTHQEVTGEPERPKGKVRPPKVVRTVKPSFPQGLRQMRVIGNLVVEAIIGEDGVPRHPLLLKHLPPAMEYVALEALRQWRFEPARLDGRAVKVYYVITVNFGFER